jgi:hypothetical protein
MAELLLRDFLEVTKELLRIKSPMTYDAFIVTEGKTDWRHLKKAARALDVHGIEYDETDRDRGDKGLLSACKAMAVIPQAKPVIFVFDRDNDRIIQQLEALSVGKKYQDWGNNIFSMLLPVPVHRDGYKRISIEMYYPDKVLKTPDQQGRRICFNNELNTEIRPDGSVRRIVVSPEPSKEYEKAIAGQDVDNIQDSSGNKVGLSKTAFAECVFQARSPFESLKFEEFEPIFRVIREIVSERAR